MTTTGLAARRQGLGVGPVRVSQVVAAQVVAAGVFLAWMFPTPTPYIVTSAGVLIVAAIVAANVRGLGYRTRVKLRRRGLRKGAAVSARGGDALAALAPGLNIVSVGERNTEFGVAYDGVGWFTGVALHHNDSTNPAGLDVGALRAVVEVLNDPSTDVSGIQLVSHLVPTPSVEIAPQSQCAQSYAELLGDDPVVSHQMTWLAVRLDIPTAARSAPERGGKSVGARRAVTAVTNRLIKRLTDAGVAHRALGADSLRVALTHSVSGDTVSAALTQQASERWGSWHLGVLAHVTFGVEGTVSDLNDLRRLWMSMAVLTTSFSTISVTFHPLERNNHDGGVWMRTLLRVAYDEELNDGVPDELIDAAAECGVRLWRYDGEQASAAYASAPTGGAFAR